MLFDLERLTVYGKSLDLVSEAHLLANRLPSGRAYLYDQLTRAAISVTLNIAEGAGEYQAKEKARLYRIARRSAIEVAATLDVCRRTGALPEPALARASALLKEVVAMLTTLAKHLARMPKRT